MYDKLPDHGNGQRNGYFRLPVGAWRDSGSVVVRCGDLATNFESTGNRAQAYIEARWGLIATRFIVHEHL